jgi:diguanylate cyclase (GGDEF)-like protein
MQLDTPTIFFTSAAICVPGALLLFFSWWQTRPERTLLWWSFGFFASAVGLALYVPRGTAPDFLTIDIANAFTILGISLGWAGARAFNRSRPILWVILLGPVAWLLVCRIPVIYSELSLRVAAFSLIYVAYTIGVSAEYWRGRADGLQTRYALVATGLVLSVAMIARFFVALFLPMATDQSYMRPDPAAAIVTLLPIVFSVANAVLVIVAAMDRAEADQRRLAETDPLTGMFNRGATLERTEARVAAGAGAMLLFDLDRFKQINDRFGHPAGDRVLKAFAAVAGSQLRENDIFGRIGGEEFLAFLPGADRDRAMAVAERIRAAFAETRIEKNGVRVPATVSIGIASVVEDLPDVDRLLVEADRALYAAKEMGRDRVQVFMPRAA